ncbi:MAG: flavin reductase family protein, partial [Armatimonadota bacterium]
QGNPFTLIGSDWMLITAGAPDSCNTMTASWGGLGVLWGKNICFVFIRPERYTYEFVERAENFTLSFFDERYRDALNLCGTKSGREMDKIAAAGLTKVAGSLPGSTYFAEARLVIECRKIYFQDLDPAHFLDPAIGECYRGTGIHRMYIGEIEACRAR